MSEFKRLRFEWDSTKAEANLKKHGVRFEEAITLFSDPEELLLSDPEHSENEERLISIGRAMSGDIVLACYTENEQTIRLISARRAVPSEVKAYLAQGERNA